MSNAGKKRAVVRQVPSNSDKLESSSVFIDDLPVSKLKQALRLRKLRVSGNRAILLQRLHQAIDQQKQKEREQYERGLDLNGVPCAPLVRHAGRRRAPRPLLPRLSQSLMFGVAEYLQRNSLLQLASTHRDMQRMFSMAITGTPSAYMVACPRLCLSMSSSRPELTATQLKSLFQRMVGLQDVDLRTQYLTPLALSVLGQRATRLRALSVDLRICDRFDNALEVIAVAHSCAHLHRLELRLPSRTDDAGYWRKLLEPTYQLHQLHQLRWSGTGFVPQALLEATPNLRSLHLNCDEVPRNIGRLAHLTELTLSSTVDAGFQWLAGCSALRKLDLGIDFDEIPTFVVDTIEELCLRNSLPDWQTTHSLASCFPNLRKLVLRDIYGGDDSTPRLLECPFVRELDGEVDFGGQFFLLLAEIAEQPDFMPDLERIVMRRCATNTHNSERVDEMAEKLRSARGKLEVITSPF